MHRGKQPAQSVQSVSSPELLEAIRLASSQDVQAMQLGSEQFKRMLDMSGVHDGLQEIAAQRDLPIQMRQMAALQFKNLVLSHWRARKNLPETQRTRIRARCLQFIDEPDDTIAHCNEVATAKIARQDFPRDWPTLVADLSNIIKSGMETRFGDPVNAEDHFLPLKRALLLLNGVIKELSGVKMMTGVKNMSEVVRDLHSDFAAYYSAVANKVVPQVVTSNTFLSPEVHNDILLCHLLHKIMSKMAAWMWNRLERQTSPEEAESNLVWVYGYFQTLARQLSVLITLRTSMLHSLQDAVLGHPSLDRITRLIYATGRFFLRLQKLSHPRFAQLPMASEVIQFYWAQVSEATSSPEQYIQESNNAVFPIRILVQGMQLFKDNLGQWAPTIKNKPNPNVLPQDFVESAVRALITRFMRFTQKDLTLWQEDPEAWYNAEETESDQWQFEIRACSERVLMVLCTHFPDYTSPIIVATFQETLNDTATDLESVVKKEAFYCALGRCCVPLASKISYQEWLDTKAYEEARDPNPNLLVIKRRIAWLIGTLVTNSCISATIPRTWETLVFLLRDSSSDFAVKLTATTAIGVCVGGDHFDTEIVAPYLPYIIAELVSLLSDCATLEVKRRVVHALNNVLQECGSSIVPHMSIITDALPQLWLDAGDEWALKSLLLETTTTLVESVNSASVALGSIVVPLIQDSLTPQSISQLDEDALKLWSAALRNTTTIQSVNGSRALVELFPGILQLLGTNMDLLGRIITIVESYFLLDPLVLLQNFSGVLFTTFLSGLTSKAVTINQKDMIDALCLIVQLTPSNTWAEPMHSSGLFTHLLTSLAAGEREAMLLTHYIYLFSRVVLADGPIFVQLMSATASAQGVQEATLYEGLLDQWWQRFDNMSEPRYRKLTAMGIASLVSTGRPEVLSRLPTEIFNMWLDVFGEIREACQNLEDVPDDPVSPLNLKRLWELDEPHPSWYGGCEGTPEFDRRRQVYEQDPVRNTKLTSYISQRLQEAEATCAPPGLQTTYLSDADPSVLGHIQKELKEMQ